MSCSRTSYRYSFFSNSDSLSATICASCLQMRLWSGSWLLRSMWKRISFRPGTSTSTVLHSWSTRLATCFSYSSASRLISSFSAICWIRSAASALKKIEMHSRYRISFWTPVDSGTVIGNTSLVVDGTTSVCMATLLETHQKIASTTKTTIQHNPQNIYLNTNRDYIWRWLNSTNTGSATGCTSFYYVWLDS